MVCMHVTEDSILPWTKPGKIQKDMELGECVVVFSVFQNREMVTGWRFCSARGASVPSGEHYKGWRDGSDTVISSMLAVNQGTPCASRSLP
jgi:hypothetical protein